MWKRIIFPLYLVLLHSVACCVHDKALIATHTPKTEIAVVRFHFIILRQQEYAKAMNEDYFIEYIQYLKSFTYMYV